MFSRLVMESSTRERKKTNLLPIDFSTKKCPFFHYTTMYIDAVNTTHAACESHFLLHHTQQPCCSADESLPFHTFLRLICSSCSHLASLSLFYKFFFSCSFTPTRSFVRNSPAYVQCDNAESKANLSHHRDVFFFFCCGLFLSTEEVLFCKMSRLLEH